MADSNSPAVNVSCSSVPSISGRFAFCHYFVRSSATDVRFTFFCARPCIMTGSLIFHVLAGGECLSIYVSTYRVSSVNPCTATLHQTVRVVIIHCCFFGSFPLSSPLWCRYVSMYSSSIPTWAIVASLSTIHPFFPPGQ